jgi:competence protein ComEC
VALTFLVLSALLKNSMLRDRVFSILLLTTITVAGFLYVKIHKEQQFAASIPTQGTFCGIVHDKAPSTNNRFKFTVKLESAFSDDSVHLTHEKILLYSSDSLANSKMEPGSEIVFSAPLFEISNTKNPGDFDFKRYMNRKGIRYQASVNDEIGLSGSIHNTALTTALNVRTNLMKRYRNAGIDGDEYAVLGALTLGDKNYISNEVKSSFSSSGAMHVLSVSGLHVGIIFLVLNFLLKPLNNTIKLRILNILLLLGALWSYAFITGLPPSVLRSTSMFSFLTIGQNLGRKTNTYNTLAVSAFLILLLNPLTLFEIGFQLSYMAVISIVFFQPQFASLYNPKNQIVKYVWDLLTVSLAAQLGTTPISIYYFDQFPTYFLLSNLIVVPAAAIILYLGVLFFCVSFIPIIGGATAFLLKNITSVLNFSVKTIEALPGSVIENLSISLTALALLYLLIAFASAFMLLKRGSYLVLCLSSLLLLLTQNITNEIGYYTQKKIIIYNNRTEPLISCIEGKSHYYYSTSDPISSFSYALLEKSAGYFQTSAPAVIEKSKKNTSKYLLPIVEIEGIRILINKNRFRLPPTLPESDIVVNYAELNVAINCNNKLSTKLLQNSSYLNDKLSTNKCYDLKNAGAIILDLK